MRFRFSRSSAIGVLLCLAMLTLQCGDDNGTNAPGSAQSELQVYVIDESVSPPDTLHNERLAVSTASNFIDFRDKAQIVEVQTRDVSSVRWTSSKNLSNLFAVTRPASAINGVYDIGSVPTSYSGTPAWEVSSFALFLLDDGSGAAADTVNLSLELDGVTEFSNREFIFEVISLDRAVQTMVPYLQNGQRSVMTFGTTDFCANRNPNFRDSRNLHTMILERGDLACGIDLTGQSQDIPIMAFFTSLPID
jgi:hypothetical protein